MKPFITTILVILALSATSEAFSQTDTVKVKQRALFFADSLIQADMYKNWSTYADLAPASVLKHYGGKDPFIEHIQKLYPRTVSSLGGEPDPEVGLITLMEKDNQWQCVIRESRYIHHEYKKYHLVTYFLGQSKDEGETWRIFDLSYNKVANVIYMMPDVNLDLPIPEPYIISDEEELAKQQAAASAARKTASKKK
jgi:hypothetical protein